MTRAFAFALATIGLAACTPSAEVEEASAGAATEADGLAMVSVDSIAPTRKAKVADQFISCIQDRGNGITESQFYLIKDGAVKSYSQMQNHARPMCDPGQPGCALGWQGEEVALYFETASGAVNQMLLDLDTLDMRKRLTTSTRGTEESTAKCTTGPVPEGVTID